LDDPHAPLRDDVRLLGDLLGETLRRLERDALFEQVEGIRALAKRAHADDAAAFDELTARLNRLPAESAVPIARAFSHFLTLANIAEQHHRIRRRRDYARDPQRGPQPGSCADLFARWRRAGWSAAAISDALGALHIELVLTAHPTEIVRRTLLQSQRRIADLLALRDRRDLTPEESDGAVDALRREIAIAWQTDEARDRIVTPLDEVRGGLAVFEQTLWTAVPRFIRQIDRALGATLPLDRAPLRFGSWIGGDRDGNPNVTAETTRKAVWMARWVAADLYLRDLDALRAELSIAPANDELRAATAGDREPYRALLRTLARRLRATRDFAAQAIERDPNESESIDATAFAADADSRPLDDVGDLREPLLVCYRSLTATANQGIADGRLTDILRRVAAFGLALVPLDLRQDASRHTQAIDWLARAWKLGPYADASETDRVSLLIRELSGTRRLSDLQPADGDPTDAVRDVLETFRAAARLPADSLGAYVITMASRPSDVLAVELLQQLAGNRHPQRVVPLFETAADLRAASDTLDALFAIRWYRERIGGHQEVMVGYSDSAKDAGRFAAAWALYRAQEQVAATCARRGVQLTLFHGRGGSVGRGGGPTHLAIRSQPPGSIRGRLRVTEQGEMIGAKFGLVDIAVRTMEVYTTATLEATAAPIAEPPVRWRDEMDRLAERSRRSYRALVFDTPAFLDYFRSATPEPELRGLHVGSRPARRGTAGGVESLRAIPWQFAWTQTRLLLASWLGVEEALSIDAAGEDGLPLLKTMYQQWPFFQSTLDLIEMVLAKADARIAAEYDRHLVPADLRPLGADLRARLAKATDEVLAVTGHREPIESNAVLRRSIDVRNPYVDPINLVQIALLARLRRGGDDLELRRALAATVNGIAAGMRNTG
jgi:phosphoenolpyruvate carboxylase